MTGDGWAQAAADHYTLLEFSERYPGFELLAQKLRAGGPPPRSPYGTPLILDIGPSPDDTLALACAAHLAPELAMVITADHQTARLARHLLDSRGRSDVPVTTASPQRAPGYRIPAGLIPGHIPAQPSHAVDAAAKVCAGTAGPVRWVSTYSPATLAHALARDPRIAERLVITHTGGTTKRDRHDPLQRCPDAARTVFAAATRLYLAPAAVNENDPIALHHRRELHIRLADVCTATGTGLVVEHLASWFESVAPVVHLRAVLTLCLGMRKPLISCTRRRPFGLDQHARMIPTPGVIPAPGADSRRIWTTRGVDPAFPRWLRTQALG